ncbi:hypothetical protein Tco_0765561 [Tanacetum coccineum]
MGTDRSGIYRASVATKRNIYEGGRRSEEAFQGSSENSFDPEDNRARWPIIQNAGEHQVVRQNNQPRRSSLVPFLNRLSEWPMPVWCRYVPTDFGWERERVAQEPPEQKH